MKKIIIVLVILPVLALSGCSNLYGDKQAPSDTTAMPTSPSVTSSTANVTQINVSADEFSFTPSSITLNAAEKVRLTFKNVGKVSHNFSIEGLGIATKTVAAGKTDTLEFTVPVAGEYTFFCSVGGHRNLGMEGPLTVE